MRTERLLDHLDYLIYHMPFSNMARKAHRHLIEFEYADLESPARERLFAETFGRKVEPGLKGAREVGNIYTGSVYMGLVSLLENEGERVQGKRVGMFSYGSGCGAEFFVCHLKAEIDEILKGLRFREQLERRKRITFEEYETMYSKDRDRTVNRPGDVKRYRDEFTRYAFAGLKDHKRQYVVLGNGSGIL
jgi:3-hydroxy-3-methylglutaryl CoA synthase